MAYGCLVTVGAGKVTGTLSNFTAVLTQDNFPVGSMDGGVNSILNEGGNLRCYTDETKAVQVPIELPVPFVTGVTPSCIVWLLHPSISVGDTVYIEADTVVTAQPIASNIYGSEGVWVDRKFQYNLFDVASIADSTGATNPSLSGTLVDSTFKSPIGGGVGFGASAQINLNENIGDTLGDITFRANVYRYNLASFDGIITIYDGVWSYVFRLENGHPGLLIGSSSPESTGASLLEDTWYTVHCTISGTSITYYVDGAVDSVKTVTGTRTLNPTINTTIGTSQGGLLTPSLYMDNVSVGFGAISSDTVEAEYNNQSDPSTFWVTGAWEDQGAGGGVGITPTGIGSLEDFGLVTIVNLTQILSVGSVNNTEVVNNPTVNVSSVILRPTEIDSLEIISTPSILYNQVVAINTITSEEVFGTIVVWDGVIIVIPYKLPQPTITPIVKTLISPIFSM